LCLSSEGHSTLQNEEDMGGGGSVGKGERGHMDCSPVIEGSCDGGRACWRWLVSTTEETGDQSSGRGWPKSREREGSASQSWGRGQAMVGVGGEAQDRHW
jgi:hypothetical protein